MSCISGAGRQETERKFAEGPLEMWKLATVHYAKMYPHLPQERVQIMAYQVCVAGKHHQHTCSCQFLNLPYLPGYADLFPRGWSTCALPNGSFKMEELAASNSKLREVSAGEVSDTPGIDNMVLVDDPDDRKQVRDSFQFNSHEVITLYLSRWHFKSLSWPRMRPHKCQDH